MEQLFAFWNAWGPVILLVLGTVVGLAVWVARGEGKQLAQLVMQLILNLSSAGWDAVTEEQVKDVAGRVYDGAYNWAGPAWFRVIPWRLFIKREMVQQWSWDAWQKVHEWYDSRLALKVVSAATKSGEIPKAATMRL